VYTVNHEVYSVHLSAGSMKSSAAEARVLDAAYDLYVADGMDALSMRRVALRIGITAPALYKHFDSKDALVEAIAERGFELFERRLTEAATSRNPMGTILRVLQCYRQFAIDEPQLFEIMFVVPRTRRRTFPDDFAARRSASFNLLRAAVEQAMQRKRLRKDDPLEVTLNLWAYAHGLVGLYRAGRFDANPALFRRLFDRAIRRLLSGLAPK
jgi:AcrR family transcriptional regulator